MRESVVVCCGRMVRRNQLACALFARQASSACKERAQVFITATVLALAACGGGGGGGHGGGSEGPPIFSITKTHQGSFTQGQQNATYTVTVSNTGGNQNGGGAFVTEMLPPGLTLVSMAGAGWTCSLQLPPSCNRNDSLAHGATHPPITVTLNVAADATSPQVNQVMTVGNVTASDSTIILGSSSTGAVVGTAVPFPIFAGDPATTIAVTVTNDAVGNVLTAALTGDANTGAACTPSTCGTIGPVSGTSGSGSYTLSYTPPPSTAFTAQTVPTIVVSSSLPGSFAATDYIEVDPAGTPLVTLDGLGLVAVGSAPRILTATVYNDTTHAGLSFMPLTASGFACANIGTNSCGTMSAPSTPTVSGTTTTTTVTYTPPASVPGAPYNRPRIQATSVANSAQAASTSFLLNSSVLNTGLRIPSGSKFNSALAAPAAGAITVVANIGSDTGSSRTVNWALTAGGAACSPMCGTLGGATTTGNGTFVSSAITYTPPTSVPSMSVYLTPTIVATSVDNPAAADSFSFTIIDGTCGSGNNAVLNGKYAFLVRGAGANAGLNTMIGNFAADGAGGVTGGLIDLNTNFGPALGLAVSAGGSSYSVGPDNRVCLTLADGAGDVWHFRGAVGTLVGGAATEGRLVQFDDNNGRTKRQSGVLLKQDAMAFATNRISGNYALKFDGIDSSGNRIAGAGAFAADGTGAISNLALDIDDGGSLGSNLTGGSGSYVVAATGRATAITTITAPGGPATTNFVMYVVSSSRVLFISSDSVLAGKPVQSGELRAQTGVPFAPTALDNGSYVLYTQGRAAASGGNDTQLIQATVGSNGSTTLTVDENNDGTVLPESSQSVVLTIAANGRAVVPGGPVAYLIDPTSGFLVGTDANASSGQVEKQVGGPFTTASINGAFFFLGEAATTGSSFDTGVANFDGLGNVTGTAASSRPNGLRVTPITPANGDTYSFSASAVPQGKGTAGPNSIAYAISGSKVVFMSTGPAPALVIVQK